MGATYLTAARTALSKGRVLESIGVLKENINDPTILNQVLQAEIRYNKLQQRINSGIIDTEDAQLEENKISNSILFIISNLATERPAPTPQAVKPSPQKKFDGKWLIIGILLLAVAGLVGYMQLRPSAIPTPIPDEPQIEEGSTQPDPANQEPTTAPSGNTLPNLEVISYSWSPEIPTQKEPVNVAIVVKNTGGQPSEKYTVRWRAGENFKDLFYNKKHKALQAGASETIRFSYPGYASWYGRITSVLQIDIENNTTESNEADNQIKKTYAVKKNDTTTPAATDGGNATVSDLPDLKITAFQMKPDMPVKGQKVYMQAIVKNLGKSNAGAFTVDWYAGENYPKPAFSKRFAGLAAGQQEVFSFQYDGYPSRYANITSVLKVDPENQVKESNDSNNELRKRYAVRKN